MNFWLIKSEPDCYSIDDLKCDKVIAWEGVRNYQARNFMREMNIDDIALFYHSSSDVIGIVGIAEVSSKIHSDLSALDKKHENFDPKATKDNPIWQCVDFKYVNKFPSILTLKEIKRDPVLKGMIVARQGTRLSVMPVLKREYERVLEIASSS